MKTLDRRCLDEGGTVHRSPPWGRRCGALISLVPVSVSSVASFGSPCIFLSLICCIKELPHQLVSVCLFVTFLK
jgi:hypothetical protein